jgi:hypothetical protein
VTDKEYGILTMVAGGVRWSLFTEEEQSIALDLKAMGWLTTGAGNKLALTRSGRQVFEDVRDFDRWSDSVR